MLEVGVTLPEGSSPWDAGRHPALTSSSGVFTSTGSITSKRFLIS